MSENTIARKEWQGQGTAPQHLSLNLEREEVEKQDCRFTGSGSVDIFHGI